MQEKVPLKKQRRLKASGKPKRLPGKKQKQSEQTRALLLQAAEAIFLRDGFEASKLEDIAAAAGYTRGAFYANFEGKEDLFLAMAEERIQKLVGRLKAESESWSGHNPARRLDALREHFMNAAKDRDWTIIGLELKLFSLRHPELKPKISALRRRAFAAAETVLSEQLRLSKASLPVSTTAFAVALAGITHGLELDRLVDGAISESEIKRIGRIFFDSMTKKRT